MKRFTEWMKLKEVDALSRYAGEFSNPKAYSLFRLMLAGNFKTPYRVEGVTPAELKQMWDEIQGVDPEAADSYVVDLNNLTINDNPNPTPAEEW